MLVYDEIANPIINAAKRQSKPVLPSVAQTKNSEGLKISTHIVLTLSGDQKVFSQPCQYCNFLYRGGAIHGFTLELKICGHFGKSKILP